MSPQHEQSRTQQGSAVVLAVVLCLVLSTFAVGAAALSGVLVASRQAAAAADLAALAAAEAVVPGRALIPDASAVPASACDRARRVSAANGAELSGCRVTGDEVFVRVTVEAESVLGTSLLVPGRARAGPAQSAAQSAGQFSRPVSGPVSGAWLTPPGQLVPAVVSA